MSKYICVFCNERKTIETADTLHKNIGICRECADKLSRNSPSLPFKGTSDISYIMSPFEYTGSLRKAMIDFKFNNCFAYAPLFADMMKDYLNSYNIWDRFDFIIPVPLHKNRLKQRGYNQSELIAEHISEYLNIPIERECITRTRSTQKQSNLKRAERILNIRNAFTCNYSLSGKSILLFDDICTTGNTLNACASALKNSGAEYICALTFAMITEQELPILTY